MCFLMGLRGAGAVLPGRWDAPFPNNGKSGSNSLFKISSVLMLDALDLMVQSAAAWEERQQANTCLLLVF